MPSKSNRKPKQQAQRTASKAAKPERKGLKKFLLITAILATIVAVFCLIQITFWWLDNQRIEEETELAQTTANLSSVKPNLSDQDNPNKEFDPYWDFAGVNLLEADFNELKKLNPEINAWITVDGTNINYPTTQHSDNDYYLNHSLSNATNSGGWVFMDYRNQNFGVKESSGTISYPQNTIIYAHGRQDRSMFGSLYKVLYADWAKQQENQILKISTPEANSLWRTFSVYQIPNTNDYIQTDFQSEGEFGNFLDMLQKRSVFDFRIKIDTNDHIITLSTCANDHEKIVLHAKLIHSEPRS